MRTGGGRKFELCSATDLLTKHGGTSTFIFIFFCRILLIISKKSNQGKTNVVFDRLSISLIVSGFSILNFHGPTRSRCHRETRSRHLVANECFIFWRLAGPSAGRHGTRLTGRVCSRARQSGLEPRVACHGEHTPQHGRSQGGTKQVQTEREEPTAHIKPTATGAPSPPEQGGVTAPPASRLALPCYAR